VWVSLEIRFVVTRPYDEAMDMLDELVSELEGAAAEIGEIPHWGLEQWRVGVADPAFDEPLGDLGVRAWESGDPATPDTAWEARGALVIEGEAADEARLLELALGHLRAAPDLRIAKLEVVHGDGDTERSRRRVDVDPA
jgi:hypothetical protein